MRKFLIFFLLLGACSKSKTDITPENCFVSTILSASSMLSGTERFLYKFDEQTRIASVERANSSTITTYIYEASKLIIVDKSPSGTTKTYQYTITKDSQGRIISIFEPIFGNQHVITYNADGYLSTVEYRVNGKMYVSSKRIYKDGNMVENTVTDDQGRVNVYKYTYDLTKKNYSRIAEYALGIELPAFSAGKFLLGPMLGESLKNLPVKAQLGSEESPMSYEFDSRSRPTQLNILIKNTTLQSFWEYNCP